MRSAKLLVAALLLVAGCKSSHSRAPNLAPAAPVHAQPKAASAGDDEPEVALPLELANRPVTKDALGLYADGKLTRTVPAAELTATKKLDAYITAPARSLLVHASTGNVWLAGTELASFQLRVNRRGMIKLEPASVGGGEHHGEGGADESAGKQLRDVQWIEARSKASPKLTGEP